MLEHHDYIQFAGDWCNRERQFIGQAVQEYEGAIQDEPASWVCLRLRIENTPYYLGYRLGKDELLEASSAALLDRSSKHLLTGSQTCRPSLTRRACPR